MKVHWSYLRVLMLLALMLHVVAVYAERVTADRFTYEIYTDGTATLVSADESIVQADIPESFTYGGEKYAVTKIGSMAFSENQNLKSIKVPGTVGQMEAQSVYRCLNLEQITFTHGDSPLYLATYAIDNAKSGNVADEISVPATLYSFRDITTRVAEETIYGPFRKFKLTYAELENSTLVPERLFYGCKYLETVIIPHGPTSIASDAFRGCEALKELTLPEGVASIGSEAFFNCKSLEQITLPATLVQIDGQKNFGNATSLKDVFLYAVTPPAFDADNLLFYGVTTSNMTLHVPMGYKDVYKQSAWGTTSDMPSITDDLTINKTVGLQIEVDGPGTVILQDEEIWGMVKAEANETIQADAITVPEEITLRAVPEAQYELVNITACLADGTEVRGTSYMKGGAMFTTYPFVDGMSVKVVFAAQTSYLLHVAAPSGDGKLTLSVPAAQDYSLIYTPLGSKALASAILDDESLDVEATDSGAVKIRIPAYEGEKTLRLVEQEDIPTDLVHVATNGHGFINGQFFIDGLPIDSLVQVVDVNGFVLWDNRVTGRVLIPSGLHGICMIRCHNTIFKVNL